MISDIEYQQWLERPGELRCALLELTFAGNNTGALGEFKAFVANMPYVTSGSDAPPNQIFDNCVVDVPSFTFSMGDQLEGRSTQSYADLLLANPYTLSADGSVRVAGERDAWYRMNWDARRVRQWIGSPAWPFADFRLVLDGVNGGVFDPGGYKIGFHLSDKSALLDRPVITALLGGTGPHAGDLMPMAWGTGLANITPKLTDEINHIYRYTGTSSGGLVEKPSLNDGGENPTDMREDGISLQTGLKYLTSADPATDLIHWVAHGFLENTRIVLHSFSGGDVPPAPLVFGQNYFVSADGLVADYFKVSATRGGAPIDLTSAHSGVVTIRGFDWTVLRDDGSVQLAGNPSGLITMDCVGLCTGALDPIFTAGDIVNEVLTSSITNTPLTSDDIDADSLSAFTALCNQSIAYYLTDKINFSDLLDAMILSVGGWWGLSSVGKTIFGRLDLPVAGTPDYSFVAGDMAFNTMKMERLILPRAQIKLIGASNWTQQKYLARDATAPVFGEFPAEWNRSLWMGPDQQTTGIAPITTWQSDPASHRGAVHPDPYKTYLSNAYQQQAETNRVATMFQYPLAIFGFDTHHAVYLIERGSLIYVEHPRYTGYGIVVGGTKAFRGRSHVSFLCRPPEIYPSEDIE